MYICTVHVCVCVDVYVCVWMYMNVCECVYKCVSCSECGVLILG